jgi:hypothetical protein
MESRRPRRTRGEAVSEQVDVERLRALADAIVDASREGDELPADKMVDAIRAAAAEITALRERVAELGRYHDDYPPEDIAELQADMMRSAQTCRTALARAEAAEADAARYRYACSRMSADEVAEILRTACTQDECNRRFDAAMSERKEKP